MSFDKFMWLKFESLKTSIFGSEQREYVHISDVPGFSGNQATLLDGTGIDQP